MILLTAGHLIVTALFAFVLLADLLVRIVDMLLRKAVIRFYRAQLWLLQNCEPYRRMFVAFRTWRQARRAGP